jgi:hypothetical protein
MRRQWPEGLLAPGVTMHRFLHVAFYFGERIKTNELEGVFTAIGDDWIRYSGLSWILWTDRPAPHVYALLSPHLGAEDQVLISALSFTQNDMYGSIAPWIWGWINSKSAGLITTGPEAAAALRLPASKLRGES